MEKGTEAEAPEQVVSEVEVENAERDVWLVKVPNFVDERWRGVIEESRRTGEAKEVAEITFGDDPKLRLINVSSVSSAGAKTTSGLKQIPLDYELRAPLSANDLTCMHALAGDAVAAGEDDDEKTALPSFEGKVSRQFAVQPKIDKTYRAVSRDRMRLGVGGGTKNRLKASRIQQVSKAAILDSTSAFQISKAATPLPVSYVGGAKYKREQGRKQADYKRVAMKSKDDLMNWLFELFALAEYWHFSDLQEKTNQPTRFLMEVLRECADKVYEGDHVNKWRLKEKYSQG